MVVPTFAISEPLLPGAVERNTSYPLTPAELSLDGGDQLSTAWPSATVAKRSVGDPGTPAKGLQVNALPPPRAIHNLEVGQDTDEPYGAPDPIGVGRDHDAPFQMKLLPPESNAMQNVVVGQETELSA